MFTREVFWSVYAVWLLHKYHKMASLSFYDHINNMILLCFVRWCRRFKGTTPNQEKLYSGNAWTSPVPKKSRLIGHVHPNETATQLWPSPGDMNTANARYFRELIVNPNAKPKPTRIFWGSGNADNTIFYPGLGKTALNKGRK